MKRFGTSYGGFYYPNELNLGNDSVIYCVGAGEDISHDCEIAKATGATVHILDPTPRAVTHVQYIKDLLDGRIDKIASRKFGGGDPTYLDRILDTGISSEKLIIHDFGIGPETNDEVPFFSLQILNM